MIHNTKSHYHCHAYSPDSRYLAIVEHHSEKDHVGIYDLLNSFNLVRHFPILTNDIQRLIWSPCGKHLAVVDHLLTYSLYMYTPLGILLHHLNPSHPSFNLRAPSEDVSGDCGLGIRTAVFAPGGRWIVCGGWDGRVRVWECDTGRCIGVIGFGNRVGKETVVWQEPNDWLKDTRGHGIVQFDKLQHLALPTVSPDLTCYPPKSGPSHILFSPSSTHLAIRLETQPKVLHVLTFLPNVSANHPDIRHLCSIVFVEEIRGARWEGIGEGEASHEKERTRGEEYLGKGSRKGERIVITTKVGGVFNWDESGWEEEGFEGDAGVGGCMEGIGIPTFGTEFKAHDIIWSPDTRCLAVLDKIKSQFCILYEDDEPSPSSQGKGRDAQNGRMDWQGVSGHGSGSEGLSFVEEGEEEGEDEYPNRGFMGGIRSGGYGLRA